MGRGDTLIRNKSTLVENLKIASIRCLGIQNIFRKRIKSVLGLGHDTRVKKFKHLHVYNILGFDEKYKF